MKGPTGDGVNDRFSRDDRAAAVTRQLHVAPLAIAATMVAGLTNLYAAGHRIVTLEKSWTS